MSEWTDAKISEWVDGFKLCRTLQAVREVLFLNQRIYDPSVDDYLTRAGVICQRAFDEDKCRWIVPNPSDESTVALVDALVELDVNKITWLMARIEDGR